MTTVPNSLIIDYPDYPFEKKKKFNPIIILTQYESLNNLHPKVIDNFNWFFIHNKIKDNELYSIPN